jgi:predicted ATPase
MSEMYPDGVFWVPLAPLRDPALLPQHVGQVLAAPGDLVEHIADKRLLLVLDNFEHLVNAAREVAVLLLGCRRLNLLVTSRERLHLDGEHEWPVPPLARQDAVVLFRQRASAVGVEIETEAAVIELCERLDSLPLALELAAARTKLFTPGQLLERISQRLDLLKGGRDADPRQETLRATIDWSYDLLTPEEQRTFARLSVFAGGSTIEAAEAVCEASPDALAALVDKSLIRRSGERIWMLETIRQYAVERLAASGEAEAVRRCHAEQFLALAERVGRESVDGDIAPWLPLLDAEAANLRTALTYLAETERTELVARTATPLFHYWVVRNLSEGRSWLEQAAETTDDRLRSRALYGLGFLALRSGDVSAARAAANEALLVHQRLGDDRGAARSTQLLGVVASNAGDLDEAFALGQRAAELMRASGDRTGLATTLGNLGYLALQRGDYDGAIARSREAITLYTEFGRGDQVAVGLINLGYASLGKHEDESAHKFFTEGLRVAHDLRDVFEVAYCLEGLAAVVARTEPEYAARLLGAAEAACESVGGSLDPVEREVHERTVELVRAKINEEAFGAAWEEGRALRTNQAVAFALDG